MRGTMPRVISTEFPHLTAGNFESSLSSDVVLAQFFNDFLNLPSFSEGLLYNQETGLFEVTSGAAEFVSTKIRSAIKHTKLQLLTGDPAALARNPPVDNHYTVCCLDKEQGIQWIKRERLAFFLRSDCYYEYRLAKLLLQWDPNLCIHQRKSSSSRTAPPAPRLRHSSQSSKERHNVTSNQTEHINTKSSKSSRCYSRPSEPEYPCTFSSSPQRSQTDLSLDLTERSTRVGEEQHPKGFDSPEQQLAYLAAKVVKHAVKDSVKSIDGESRANSETEDQTNCASSDKRRECKVFQQSTGEDSERLEREKEKVQDGKRGVEWEEKTEWKERKMEVGRRVIKQENVPDICCHGTCCHGRRPGFEEFKNFLRERPGEKLLDFWMDIERLKATQHRERKNRYLQLMRNRYLLRSSQSSLNEELLSSLGLNTSPCWTEEKLRSVQPCLTESLLFYWAPRFWASRCVQEHVSSGAGLSTEWCERPLSGVRPCHTSATLAFLHLDPDLSEPSHTVHSQFLSNRGRSRSSGKMQAMLQALFLDFRAGSPFTLFCEQSGNKLWVNAVYFWTDLRHYHELFHQDGRDPYRIQREAQLLYSTYLSSCAGRSVGVDEEIRGEVRTRMIPAFEELFDVVEVHTLNVLLEPWTLLVNRDNESFQRVCVQEEVRCIDTQEYKELQSLYEESQLKLKQVVQCSSTQFPSSTAAPARLSKGTRAAPSSSSVYPSYRGYSLGALLHQHHEFGQFMSFLQSQDASIHLTFWLELHQYGMTPQKDKAIRQERSSHIATTYLNRKYFFGSGSPATTEQQSDILRWAGGPELLESECLSNSVVMKIQDVVRNYIEKTWMPLFMTERQKHKAKPQAADKLSRHVYRRPRKRREAWKAEGASMSSTKEVSLFRRILLNPVTCQQFQHFVSLKGDFLENDVLFWLEVQRYKDLCHSHSDEATIQKKISTIISCFINSSTPPALQIDVPPEQAQRILEQRHKLGPYIFREPQMSVFAELLKFWPEFQELSSSVPEEQLLPLLQEKRAKHRARERRQKRKEKEEEEVEEEEEDKKTRAQEGQERQESSSRQDEETLDDEDDEDETKEDGGRDKKQPRPQSRDLLTPTQTWSWSYSRYVAGLKREELQLRRRQNHLETFSAASDSSSACSVKRSYCQRSHRSSATHSKQCNR
ncbi:regulator of G-protein signaling 22 [Mugil cephalus]|uniref:regulator of G-protein signaling 22 n=1 Tax=Mugil cephalus TaxID=48193 RepID=UPI001FB6F13C|nr:regulator of G-protein signaling 22 [Mugil cephalus]